MNYSQQLSEVILRTLKEEITGAQMLICTDQITSLLKKMSSKEIVAAEPLITKFVAKLAIVTNMTKSELAKAEGDLQNIDLLKQSRIQGENA